MQSNPQLLQLASSKKSKQRRLKRVAISMVYIGAFMLVIYGIVRGQAQWGSFATGLSFLGAATVVALQNFIASFFTFLYLTLTNQYDRGDIIKIGDPRMTCIGEVLELWVFSTTIRELDNELLFTGREFTLPNNIFFTAWVLNYTKDNLLFWHTMTMHIALASDQTCEEVLQCYRTIIQTSHTDIMTSHQQRYDNTHTHHPKYKYTITDTGIEIEVRAQVHFYNVLEYNNLTVSRLIDAHRAGKITLVEHKDYKWVFSTSGSPDWL